MRTKAQLQADMDQLATDNAELKTTIDRLTKQEALYQHSHDTDQRSMDGLRERIEEEQLKTTITRESLLEVIRELVRGES